MGERAKAKSARLFNFGMIRPQFERDELGEGLMLATIWDLVAEDVEWIISGENWPLAGTHRGHGGLDTLLQRANETVETSYPASRSDLATTVGPTARA